jgi:hypothetical protein
MRDSGGTSFGTLAALGIILFIIVYGIAKFIM